MKEDKRIKQVTFIECKWQDNIDCEKILRELKEKTKTVIWKNEDRKETFCIIAKSFIKRIKEDNLFLFDLNDSPLFSHYLLERLKTIFHLGHYYILLCNL